MVLWCLEMQVNKKFFLNPSSSLGKVRGILISQRKRKIKIRTIDGEQLPELLQSSWSKGFMFTGHTRASYKDLASKRWESTFCWPLWRLHMLKTNKIGRKKKAKSLQAKGEEKNYSILLRVKVEIEKAGKRIYVYGLVFIVIEVSA